jgi:hypothetical protein
MSIDIGPTLAHVLIVWASALFLTFAIRAKVENKIAQAAITIVVLVGYFMIVGLF